MLWLARLNRVNPDAEAAGGEPKMRRFLKKLAAAEDGQDLIEYALLAATVAVAAAAVLPPTIMPAVSQIFSKISSTLALS